MKKDRISVKRILPVASCILFIVTYILVILFQNLGNPLSFVRVGGHFDPRVGGQAMGYDGQFGYQIAIDPVEGWKYVDIPAYRYQRSLYPVLVRVLSFGQIEVIPWMMIAVNLIAAGISLYFLVKILNHFQQSGWYALVYGLFIGTLMSIRLDLNEILAYAFVVIAIYLWLSQKHGWATVFFALAILTKEITLLFLAGFALSAFIRHPLKGMRMLVLGLLPFLLLKIGLFAWFKDWGFNSGGAMATSFEWIPYFGWWKLAFINPKNFALVSLIVFPLAVLPSITGIVVSIRQFLLKKFDPLTITLFLCSLLIPFLPSSNLLDPLGLSRAMMALVIALLLYAAKENNSRLLNSLLLFCITALFIWGDSFLPVGTYKP